MLAAAAAAAAARVCVDCSSHSVRRGGEKAFPFFLSPLLELPSKWW